MQGNNKDGNIPNHLGIWPHEYRCAQALRAAGKTVEFLPAIQGDGVKTADLVMDGIVWEMKSPESTSIKSLQRILRRASKQSSNVIVDTSRATSLSDAAIERELRRLLPFTKSVKRLLMVTKAGDVVDLFQ